jgi:hypothetical protein
MEIQIVWWLFFLWGLLSVLTKFLIIANLQELLVKWNAQLIFERETLVPWPISILLCCVKVLYWSFQRQLLSYLFFLIGCHEVQGHSDLSCPSRKVYQVKVMHNVCFSKIKGFYVVFERFPLKAASLNAIVDLKILQKGDRLSIFV